MIDIGIFNTLEILRSTPPGLFLGDEEGNEVLLPNRYVPETFEVGDKIDVFTYLDNEERLIAVTDKPFIQKGDFALLRCNEVNKYGSFLDWGLVKELFCPFKEQAFKMQSGKWYLVHCYLDETSGRLVASSKTKRFLDNSVLTVNQFDEVDVIISHPTDLGYSVIVNKSHEGLIYKDTIFSDVSVGDELKGVVNKIRNGNKLDITIGKVGYRSLEPNSSLILEKLKSSDGFLPYNDKSSPEDIKEVFQLSKKNFKKAIGVLYKKRLINIEEDGVSIK